MSALDSRIVRATQAGLPLVPRPYLQVAERIGISEVALLGRLRAMLADGRIRRIGAVPNHYALGYSANAMAVWDVVDETVDALGRLIGAMPCVTHCYRRPRRPPGWPYNLFTMVHGASRADTEEKIAAIRAALGSSVRAGDVLYSTRMLKKTGLRIV